MKGRKTGGRKKGVSNRISAAIVAEAKASGLLPHEMSLWHARDAFNREQACRAAANERGISPERQRELLQEAQELAEWCEVCCKHSAKFYAPIMHQVAGDKDKPLVPLQPIVAPSEGCSTR
jgi:hypothetical protein